MTTISTLPVLLGWTPGPQELIICLIVFVLIFGSAKLPTLMRNMGRSVNEFKAGMGDKPTPPKKVEEDETNQERINESEKEPVKS